MPTVINSLKLWPLAHVINFAFIPPAQRILYINVIAVCTWSAGLPNLLRLPHLTTRRSDGPHCCPCRQCRNRTVR